MSIAETEGRVRGGYRRGGPIPEEPWHVLTNLPELVKFQYSDTAYRLVAHLNDRGHWEVRFTSVWGTDSYLVAGNLGGGKLGRLRALAKVREFRRRHENGCPPPGEME